MNSSLCILRSSLIDKKIDRKNDKLIVITKITEVLKLDTILLTKEEYFNNSKYIQLFPFITVIDKITNKILCTRGNLRSRINSWSIGVGGTIKIPTNDNTTLQDVMLVEILRYLSSELKFPVSDEIINKIEDFITKENFGIIYSNETAENKFRLCLSLVLPIVKEEYKTIFTDENINQKWLDVNQLINDHNSDVIHLDDWSKSIVYVINKYLQV